MLLNMQQQNNYKPPVQKHCNTTYWNNSAQTNCY